ncbi:DUF2628 domain-containing protein [Kushneria marisflavi]|uniref:Uncharacterized protein n=1 Tax=Kushneria marisflavi TaxID=157779 RepID=A0A240UKZ1_9GAMM|nr:DUF2628 domain-containing protein [Kushneria marisflavi]ART61689.1 hypothetical protein B9H00_00275 [Kushneria marisflavi]RKD86705.1 uncharacterized protein DUF2628 [Kushneria marisflavi]
MKQFEIYQHADGRLEAVKQGWNWPAFFFGALWALCCRLWKIAVLTLVAVFVVSMAGAFDDSGMIDVMANIACLGLYTAFGLNGNQWKRRHLLANGAQLMNTVEARGVKQAIAMHRERQQLQGSETASHNFQA